MIVYAIKAWRKIERGFKRLYRPSVMRRLEHNNQNSTRAIIAPGGPVVSLTTFGDRVNTVFYAIESIAEGNLLPSKLTLWVDPELANAKLPQSLRNLQSRGLEIAPTEDFGPHTKYFGEIQRGDFEQIPFVTADDDILYPKNWLHELVQSYQSAPQHIHCFRAHSLEFDPEGKILPYSSWKPCVTKEACHTHFSTGVCGVLFPPIMRKELAKAGKKFTDVCPHADDIWLNYVAMRSGVKVKQVVHVPKKFYEIPGTRAEALANINNGQGANDKQLANTYSKADLAELFSIKCGRRP